MGDLMMYDLCGAGFNVLRKAFFVCTNFYCPNRGAMGIIVVSLSCTANLWGALIVLCQDPLLLFGSIR